MANTLRAAQATQCDLFLVIGTSAVVHPAAGFIGQAKAADAFVVELNLEPTPATEVVDLSLLGRSEEVLDRVEALLQADAPAP